MGPECRVPPAAWTQEENSLEAKAALCFARSQTEGAPVGPLLRFSASGWPEARCKTDLLPWTGGSRVPKYLPIQMRCESQFLTFLFCAWKFWRSVCVHPPPLF